jgi:hypothetical protein
MNPNFLCVGTQKSGTTFLYHILKQHPQVFLPIKKELHFFDDQSNYKKGMQFYLKQNFSTVKNEAAIGEISPGYMYFDYVPKRIYEELGNKIKFIFILRDPVKRAYSHYLMSCAKGFENQDFENALNLENDRIKKSHMKNKKFSYFHRGLYAAQIKEYVKFFPIENMKFIKFEDFISNKEDVLKEVCEFLEVDPHYAFDFNIEINQAYKAKNKIIARVVSHINKTISKNNILTSMMTGKIREFVKKAYRNRIMQKVEKSISSETEKELRIKYHDDVLETMKLTKLDLSDWL